MMYLHDHEWHIYTLDFKLVMARQEFENGKAPYHDNAATQLSNSDVTICVTVVTHWYHHQCHFLKSFSITGRCCCRHPFSPFHSQLNRRHPGEAPRKYSRCIFWPKIFWPKIFWPKTIFRCSSPSSPSWTTRWQEIQSLRKRATPTWFLSQALVVATLWQLSQGRRTRFSARRSCSSSVSWLRAALAYSSRFSPFFIKFSGNTFHHRWVAWLRNY